jgi:hypothetical protein
MNKSNKVIRDAAILGVLVIVLVIVGISQFKQIGTSPTPKPAKKPAEGQQAAATGKTLTSTPAPADEQGSGKVVWHSAARVVNILDEVAGGRDPFNNLLVATMPPADLTPEDTPTPPEKEPDPFPFPSGDNSGFEPVEHKKTVALAWVKPEILAKAFSERNLLVNLAAGKKGDEVVLTGTSPDFEEAVQVIAALDVPPPVPNFKLSGIIDSQRERFVAISLDGKMYTLTEGETIPNKGWKVKKITTTGVVMTNGI